AHTVLDCTYGKGNFWKPIPEQITRLVGQDIQPGLAPHGVCDVKRLDHATDAFDLTVFDPPHVADGGRDGIMANRYGTLTWPRLEELVRKGAAEVMRVGRIGCLIKVTDGVHGGRLCRMSEWVTEELGEPFDVIHSIRGRPLVDPKWGKQQHAYSNGSTY